MTRRVFWHNVAANLLAAAIVYTVALLARRFGQSPPDVI
jgi:hypothetical protein